MIVPNLIDNVAAARRDQILLLGDSHGDYGDYGDYGAAGRDQILLLGDYGDYGDYGGGHFNGHGHGHQSSIHIHDQKNSGGFRHSLGMVDLHPDTVLAGVTAFGALALLGFYVAATQNTNGKRRRKRQLDDYSPLAFFDYVEPLIVAGKDQMNMFTFALGLG